MERKFIYAPVVFTYDLEKNIPYRLPQLEENYCRYILYYDHEEKNHFVDDSAILLVNNENMHVVDKDNFTYIDLREGVVRFSSILRLNYRVKYRDFIGDTKCIAKQIKYLSLETNVIQDTNMPVLEVSLKEVDFESAKNIINNRKLILK